MEIACGGRCSVGICQSLTCAFFGIRVISVDYFLQKYDIADFLRPSVARDGCGNHITRYAGAFLYPEAFIIMRGTFFSGIISNK